MIDIAPECDAVQLQALLASAIVSFPAGLRHKGIGLVVTISWLQAVNFARIVTLYFIGSHFDEEIFHTAHEVVWPILLILITMATWVLWARWVGDRND
jgi:exosortase/archaeosortase family protein